MLVLQWGRHFLIFYDELVLSPGGKIMCILDTGMKIVSPKVSEHFSDRGPFKMEFFFSHCCEEI